MKTSARTQELVRGVRDAAPPALAKKAVSSWFNIATLSAWMLGFGALSASAQPAVDGTLDAAYGAALAVQSVQTQFGDANPPGNLGGSELDAAYATIVNGRLYLMLTGNHEPNFNKLEVFIDSKPGGENVLTGTPQYDFFNGSTWISQNMIGLTFDAGFAADYHLFSRWGSGSGSYQADFVNRQGGGSAQVPGSTGSTPNAVGLQASGVISAGNVGPNASGTALSQNIQFAINDNNTGGVTGGTGAANTAAALAVTTGMEFSIALADLGNPPPGATIRVAAMIDNGDHNYLSNQLLGGLAAPQGNLGGDGAGNFTGTLSGVNLNSFAGLQYFVITVPTANRPPVAVCNNITVAADDNCQGNGSVNGGSSDPDGDPLTITQSPAGPYPVGTNAVTLIVSDSNSVSTCQATVTVVDLTPPNLDCPTNAIVVGNDPGQCAAVVNYTITATDNCAGPTVTVDPSQDWLGFMNVFNLPAGTYPPSLGGYQFGSPWGKGDLAAYFTGSVLTLAPNTIGDPDPYWYTPSGGPGSVGNKIMDANMYVEPPAGTLAGINLTFTGTVLANTLVGNVDARTNGWTSVAFIKDFAPDYSSFHTVTAPLVNGVFSITLATVNDPARHVQYGFETIGPDVWVTDVAPFGSIQVGPANIFPKITCDPPSGSVFPKGTTTVCCTATDAAGNTNACCFTVTVEDREAPRVACRPAPNPSGKKIPVSGKNPSSGQNPDGYYQLLARDNCDANPLLYVNDTASSFLAGPFASGDIVKLKQNPGGTPKSDPGNPPIVAEIHLNGDGLLIAVDADGNVSPGPCLMLIPPDPK